MIVSAWHDGHGTYGLRVRERDVGLWFRPEWRWVTVVLPGDRRPLAAPLSEGFWRGAPELRSPRIRHFLGRHGLLGWPRQQPPQFDLEPIGGGLFRLGWLGRPKGQGELWNHPE